MSAIATAPAVFITVPKYVAISPNTTLPKIRPAPSPSNNHQLVVKAVSPAQSEYSSSASDDGASKAKKRRLDHLTWEEKIQRKKLKNRVAAQTSRDRKKARMEEMDHEIQELNEKTEILQNKCESLQAINESLMAKNQKLDMEVELLREQLTELQKQQENSLKQMPQVTATVASCAGCESILNGSAVSTYTDDPLQQGSTKMMDSQSAQAQQQLPIAEQKRANTLAALWRIVAICLLYKTCSSSTSSTTTKNSMPISLKNLPKAYSQISQQTWKQAIERAMDLLPKLQAEQSGCLDQWWGPQQNAWNPANIAKVIPTISA